MPNSLKTPSRRGSAGIGLLVVLITLALILLLYFGTFGGKSYMQTAVAAKKSTAQTVQDINTDQLTKCIAIYRMNNNGKLPATADDLEAGQAIFDPWKKPMTFSFKTTNEGRGDVVYVTWHSDGPDGVPNTPDDVNKTEVVPGI